MRTGRAIVFALLPALLAAGLAGAGTPDTAAAAAPDSTGRWVSVGCETTPGARGPQYVTRDLRLTPTAWVVDLSIYADPQCADPTLGIRVEGPFLLGLPSPTVPGATEALFVEAAVRLTPRTAERVTFLNGAPAGTCGSQRWAVGVEQDVTATGCALLDVRPPAAEYDLVKREGDTLFLGARPPAGSDLNAPERRPTTLNAPLVRVAAPPTLPNTGEGGRAARGGLLPRGGAVAPLAVLAGVLTGGGYAALRRRQTRATWPTR